MTDPTLTICGASDDLIEVEGAITEELNGLDAEGWLALSDGTLLSYKFGHVWRFDVDVRGTARIEIVKCEENDEDNYSDRVTVTGDVRWIAKVDDTFDLLRRVPGFDSIDAGSTLNSDAVKTALQEVIGHVDYDTAKMLDPDTSESGEDGWPEQVDRFMRAYAEAVR